MAAISEASVTFDDEGVQAVFPGGERRALAWNDVTMVGIRTTADGPWFEDVFWGLHGPDGEPVLVYGNGAAGARNLLVEMQRRLPGFDDGQVIEAMGSAGDAFFLIWKKAEEKKRMGSGSAG